jgi:hypothetical protein
MLTIVQRKVSDNEYFDILNLAETTLVQEVRSKDYLIQTTRTHWGAANVRIILQDIYSKKNIPKLYRAIMRITGVRTCIIKFHYNRKSKTCEATYGQGEENSLWKPIGYKSIR